ncbi:uncharacterized protein HMPREF1541_06761 [Cyphellophora europaea CBS 101466]|uniref:KANL3/Tex30 alpha/beta hydrolase-like domain-containing protein n=1 Tax=Cyphellophora europaea (strain CBS 101466) TaxID=1220924 RepID=W2RSJ7_CYPE1|nr:uncharacterized protein HMPREF1541_06761 [Cyphellophora europaea CBS 101466]ETN38723.1 hypothetical protein HMPREF1541_06761 [Cyphellophora europaea CBS 101466]
MPPRSRKAKQGSSLAKPKDDGPHASENRTEQHDSPVRSVTYEVPFDKKSITCERHGSESGKPGLIFTHGAGGGISNPATKLFAEGSASRDTATVCFEGSMNLQSRVKAFHAVVEHENGQSAALGGRSMGARAAVLAAKEHQTQALVLASYPLIGQNGDLRDQILLEADADKDILFISGDADNMCPIERLNRVRAKMKAHTWLAVVKGADHGMALKPKDAVEKMRIYTGRLAAQWLSKRDSASTECSLRWDAHQHEVVDGGWKAPVTSTSVSSKRPPPVRGQQAEDASEGPSKKQKKT